jgi:hypothetical protein
MRSMRGRNQPYVPPTLDPVVRGRDRSAALHFHHLDPARKRLAVSAYGQGLGLEVLRGEAAERVLLCANRHAEVESGLWLDSGTMGENDP